MLALAVTLRLIAWKAPGGPDRAQQTVRAVGLMIALIGLTLVSEWAAVIGTDWHRDAWTGALIGGLILISLLAVATAAAVMKCRRRENPGRWRHDWLGDVVYLCRWIPGLQGSDLAAWIRRRAMTVFVALSLLAGAAVTAAQAVGERWSDPLLIAWMLIVETTSLFAFCVISNAAAGFIARPPRTRRRRVAEASMVTGCLAILIAIGFHDALWRAIGSGPLDSVPDLAALTIGPGLAISLLTAVLLLARRNGSVSP